ncbi:MAG: MFS transporter, partial [Alphaproteobacteria bacterium]|nr:MFS transporter [Alphaproteobacteria bacterium]
TFGAGAYFLLIATLLVMLALYAAYRMTQRASPASEETSSSYAPVSMSSSALAVEYALEAGAEEDESSEAS